jgi:signal transduction histidine kinase
MDIKAAFDTIKQDKMLQVVSNLLDKASYPYATCALSPKLTAIGP